MQRVITNNLGFNQFRNIQKKAIPLIFEGDNVLIIAPTATGKTEAFLLPLLDQIYSQNLKPTSMLYISPIKALINNQFIRFQKIGLLINVDCFKWHGDIESNKRKKYLENLTDILMITPESLEVILFSENYYPEDIFCNLKFVVIDEVHAFAGDERGIHLLSLLERIQQFTNFPLQRIGVSATIGNPEGMANWLKGSSNKPVMQAIDKGNRKTSVKLMYFNSIDDQMRNHILVEVKGSKSLFFTNSRSDTEKLNKLVMDYPVETYIHHSSVDKHFREKAEEVFRIVTRNNMVIFCTSTLELGIDIGDLDKVLHLNPPYRVADFSQRIGRSGRRNNHAKTVIYNTTVESLIRSIAIIKLIKNGFVEPILFRRKAWDILFHQILTLVHQEYQVSKNRVYEILKGVYSFKGINKGDFNYLLNFLLEMGYLTSHKDKLMVGKKTEKEFGYANYYNFFSVFENLYEYTVIANQEVIGTLDAFFVNTMVQAEISFFLAGKVWMIKSIDEDHLRVYVEPAQKGKIPFWMSGSRVISRWLSEEIYNVLCEEEDYHFVNQKELSLLKKERKKYKKLGFEKGRLIIEQQGRIIKIYSYAGDRINLTLGLVLKREVGANKFNFKFNEIRLYFADNDQRLKGSVKDFLVALKNKKLLMSPKLLRTMLDELPIKKVSKYYNYLPPLLQKEITEELFLDIEGSIDFLQDKDIDYVKQDLLE